ncbi:hypothetical protein Dimus_007979 [Dionaea muscipula]
MLMSGGGVADGCWLSGSCCPVVAALDGGWRRCGWAPVGGGVPLSSLAVADPELVAVTPPRVCCCSNGGRVLA